MGPNEIKNEISEIKKWEEKTQRKDLNYETKECTYDFQQYETISIVRIVEAEEDQCNLFEYLVEFNNKYRTMKVKIKKEILMKAYLLIKVEN